MQSGLRQTIPSTAAELQKQVQLWSVTAAQLSRLSQQASNQQSDVLPAVCCVCSCCLSQGKSTRALLCTDAEVQHLHGILLCCSHVCSWEGCPCHHVVHHSAQHRQLLSALHLLHGIGVAVNGLCLPLAQMHTTLSVWSVRTDDCALLRWNSAVHLHITKA